jgi:hypothetical protein
MSTGQISRILTENKEGFHREQADILATALEVASYIQCDDTGARHQGKNGYCTFIGNDFFSYFKTTESKSRINFLELLRGGCTEYHVNRDALIYAGTKIAFSNDAVFGFSRRKCICRQSGMG